jgi:hypothetical protein
MSTWLPKHGMADVSTRCWRPLVGRCRLTSIAVGAAPGVAVREFPMAPGHGRADYLRPVSYPLMHGGYSYAT